MSEVNRRTGLKVIKAFHISSQADVRPAPPTASPISTFFDTGRKGVYGGTGRDFRLGPPDQLPLADPDHSGRRAEPDNVTEAIRIVRPDAVDVASGSSASRDQDHGKLASFFQAARYTRWQAHERPFRGVHGRRAAGPLRPLRRPLRFPRPRSPRLTS